MVLLNLTKINALDLSAMKLTFHYGAIEPILIVLKMYLFNSLTFHYGAIEPPVSFKATIYLV